MILNDVCELIVDCLHSTAYDEGCGYPLIRTPNIGRGRLILDDVHRVSEKVYIERNVRATPQEDDLILAREAPAGNVAIIGRNQKVCLGQRTVLIRPDIKKVSSLYLMYYLLMPNQQYELLGTANGATVPHVNMSTIRRLPITLPNLETQKRVAKSINVYDDLIENNQKQIKLLDEAAQRVYKEWFVDLRFPGHENVEIVDGVPEGWQYKKVSSFGAVITGKTPSTAKSQYYGGEVPFIKIPDMHKGIFPLVTEVTLSLEGANSQKNKFIPKNSIMVSCIATVGLVNISIEDCQTNQQINSIVLADERSLYYLYFAMKDLKSLLDGVGSNGATMTNVNKEKFSNLSILCPDTLLLEKYYEYSKPLFDKILNLSKNIFYLTYARDRFLPKRMSGVIVV